MKKRGIGNKALSERSGVPIGTLNKIIYGDTLNPSVETMRALARVLGCTIDAFSDNPPPLYSEEIDPLVNELHANPELRTLLDATSSLDKEAIEEITAIARRIQSESK
jgi:transcriptional regulator with XRE-family HTH domain